MILQPVQIDTTPLFRDTRHLQDQQTRSLDNSNRHLASGFVQYIKKKKKKMKGRVVNIIGHCYIPAGAGCRRFA